MAGKKTKKHKKQDTSVSKNQLFILIGVLWFVIIVGFIAYHEITLQTGTEVELKTRPIDPRDLFRGDYVVLSYDIGVIDLNEIPSAHTYTSKETIFVSLDATTGMGLVDAISTTKPASGLFIKGTVETATNTELRVKYGIEEYFVPESEGREIERAGGKGLSVISAIDKKGKALIKELRMNGEIVDFS